MSRPIRADEPFPHITVYLKVVPPNVSPLSPSIDGVLHQSMGNDFLSLAREDGTLVFIPWNNIAFVVMESEVNK